MHLLKSLALSSLLVLSNLVVLAQSNPAPQTIPYSQNFDTFNGAQTSYPAGWQGWGRSASTALTFPTVAFDFDRNLQGGDNAVSGVRVMDMDGKLGMLNTGSALAAFVLALNTTDKSKINVKYVAATQRQQDANRIGAIGLQYRVGLTGDFINIPNTEYRNPGGSNNTSGTGAIAPAIIEVELPEAAENQAVVHLRWVYREVSGSGNRPSFSIDNVEITSIDPDAEPELAAFYLGQRQDNNATVQLGEYGINTVNDFALVVRNIGGQQLTFEAFEQMIEEGGFSIISQPNIGTQLGANQSTEIGIRFERPVAGTSQLNYKIETNAGTIELNFSATAFNPSELITIEEARTRQQGSRVKVTGWVTVADEFLGPVYFQDATAGLAWYRNDMRVTGQGFTLDIQRGDSIVVEGTLGNFNGLLQIVGDDATFTVHRSASRDIAPRTITIADLNSGEFESQLVALRGIQFSDAGVFPTNSRNYTITGPGGSAQFRYDQNTNIGGTNIPVGDADIAGVIGRFNQTFQITARDAADLGLDPVSFPGEDVSRDQTFDVVTWNVEWFGSAGNGPADVDLQFANVLRVIRTVDADLWALQEISNVSKFNELVDSLRKDGYGGFLATFGQTQRTAYIFNTSTIDSLASGLLTVGQNSADWANGRFPLWFHFRAIVKGVEMEIHAYNVHAKAFDTATDYEQRLNASNSLKEFFDSSRPNANVLFLGDYNDDVTLSSYNNQPSPYLNFVQDSKYNVVTNSLSDRGFTSYRSISMIDHITFSNQLDEKYFEGTERIEPVNFIGSYLTTTSDHYPVSVRFAFSTVTSTEDPWMFDGPNAVELSQNYPNPFNPSTTINFSLRTTDVVTLNVYNMLGQRVATVVQGATYSSGTHSVTFDASRLASGMYLYRLETGSGVSLSKKMMLLK